MIDCTPGGCCGRSRSMSFLLWAWFSLVIKGIIKTNINMKEIIDMQIFALPLFAFLWFCLYACLFVCLCFVCLFFVCFWGVVYVLVYV